jgi:hypothetical protein
VEEFPKINEFMSSSWSLVLLIPTDFLDPQLEAKYGARLLFVGSSKVTDIWVFLKEGLLLFG